MENFKNQTMVHIHTSKTVSLASYIVYKSELVYRILKSGTLIAIPLKDFPIFLLCQIQVSSVFHHMSLTA